MRQAHSVCLFGIFLVEEAAIGKLESRQGIKRMSVGLS
jgi:hypothetical protein